MSAYADLTKDLLSFGKSRGAKHDDVLEGYVVASRAILLVHDEDLIAKIDSFFTDRGKLNRLIDQEKDAEGTMLIGEMRDKAHGIVGELRTSLVQK